MANLRDIAIITGQKKSEEPETGFEDITVVGADHLMKPDPQRAIHLQMIYTALKGFYMKNQFRNMSKKKGIIAMFKKIADNLSKYERQKGAEIDDRVFVIALFMKYGKKTYPGHLLGKKAIDIYNEREGQLVYTVASPSKDSEQRTLDYLSEVRGQDPDQVMDQLQDSGLFSSAFVKKWKKNMKKRRGRLQH